MFALIVILHITVSLALIAVVLLQVGKGQSIGAAFGGAGSSQTFFGSRGPSTFLSHLTTVAAALFMLTSIGLAYFSAGNRQQSAITGRAPAATEDTAPVTESTPSTLPATESAPTPMQSEEQPKQEQ